MSKWIANTLGIVSIAALTLSVLGGIFLTRHAIAAIDQIQQLGVKADKTLDQVNAPCIGIHGSTTCGPIAQLSQTIKNIGIVAGLSADQVRQSGKLVDAASSSIVSISGHLNGAADQLGETAKVAAGTAGAAQKSAEALTAMLEEGQTTLARSQPLLEAYTATGRDLDTLIKNDSITATLANFQNSTAQGNAILADFRMMADKTRADYLTPVPWYMQPIKKTGALIDISAAIARHTP